MARLLLSIGGGDSANSRDALGSTPLLIAAKNGHAAVVKLLASQRGVDIHAKDILGEAAYTLAMKGNHEAVMQVVGQAVANAGECYNRCEQPLPLAEVGASAVIPAAVGPPHLNQDDHNENVAASSAPQKSRSATAPNRHGKRVVRLGPVH